MLSFEVWFEPSLFVQEDDAKVMGQRTTVKASTTITVRLKSVIHLPPAQMKALEHEVQRIKAPHSRSNDSPALLLTLLHQGLSNAE